MGGLSCQKQTNINQQVHNIIKVIVHLLVEIKNNKICMVHVLKNSISPPPVSVSIFLNFAQITLCLSLR